MVHPQLLRQTLRLWASGVSVVTSSHNGHQAGMTVSAFNSLSLQPALILVCVNKETSTARMIVESDVFAVSILDAEQAQLSERFAGRTPLADGEDRFDSVTTFTAETGAPILEDALAWVDCRVYARHDGSTHWIVIGEVLAAGQNGDTGAPLIYFNRDYRALELQPDEASLKP